MPEEMQLTVFVMSVKQAHRIPECCLWRLGESDYRYDKTKTPQQRCYTLPS